MKYRLAVSIVLFKTEISEVQAVLDNFRQSQLSYHIFLIDNSPNDVIARALRLNKNVSYIHTGENLGFGSGHNIAIEKAKKISKFHLVLNADTTFEVVDLIEMMQYMEQNPQVGLMAPKILNPDESIQYSAKLLPTPANLIFRRFCPFKSLVDKLDHRYELKFFGFDKIIEAPFLTGCFLLINSKVFEKVSGFDDRFFMYAEDIDLVRRIHCYYKTLYYPKVSIFHSYGKGSYKNKKLLKYHIKSAISYFNKWGWFFDRQRVSINKKILEQFFLSKE